MRRAKRAKWQNNAILDAEDMNARFMKKSTAAARPLMTAWGGTRTTKKTKITKQETEASKANVNSQTTTRVTRNNLRNQRMMIKWHHRILINSVVVYPIK